MATQTPQSLRILRRRVLEEMRRPGPTGTPRFRSDRQLARFLGVSTSHMSHVLHGEGKNARGVSWQLIDRLARCFDLKIWELFWTPDVPIDGPRMPPRSS